MAAVRSVFIWAALAALILLWLPLMAVVRLFDRDPAHYRTGYLFRKLGHAMSRVNPLWDVEVTGDFPADPRRPYVVVSNHQSNADVPVVSNLPWEMKWVTKRELFRVPVVGWLLRLAGDIEVDRKDARSRAQVLATAKEYLQKRCSVMLFPEGTRSKDGRVKAFQDGAFRLAIQAGVPVLPLAVDGTANALPKHDWKFTSAVQARVHVLPEVPTAGLTKEDAPALRERVRQMVVAQIAAWRGVPAAEVDVLAALEEPAEAVRPAVPGVLPVEDAVAVPSKKR